MMMMALLVVRHYGRGLSHQIEYFRLAIVLMWVIKLPPLHAMSECLGHHQAGAIDMHENSSHPAPDSRFTPCQASSVCFTPSERTADVRNTTNTLTYFYCSLALIRDSYSGTWMRPCEKITPHFFFLWRHRMLIRQPSWLEQGLVQSECCVCPKSPRDPWPSEQSMSTKDIIALNALDS